MTRTQFSCRSPVVGLILAICVLQACGGAGGEEGAAAEEIRRVLDEQVAAWNSGDIRGFMEGYARTDSLRFASGGNVSYGWEQMLERYRRGYPDAEAMGALAFDELDIRVISPDAAVVFGRWRIDRMGGREGAGGLFTLLFEHRSEGWRIVHDHTSAASTPGAPTES